MKKGTSLDRSEGFPSYVIAQYYSKLDLVVAGERIEPGRGSIIIVEPDVPHGYDCKEDLLHHWLHVEGEEVDLCLKKYGVEPNRLYELHSPNEISSILRKIAMIYHDRRIYREEYLRLKVEELIVAVAMQINLQTRMSDIDFDTIVRLRKLRQDMFEHPEYDWNIAEMANRMFISESYLSLLYKKCFSITPNRDLIELRVDRACALLDNELAISEIGEQCGYSNAYHFSRQFKQVMGMSPSQYRKTKMKDRIQT